MKNWRAAHKNSLLTIAKTIDIIKMVIIVKDTTKMDLTKMENIKMEHILM